MDEHKRMVNNRARNKAKIAVGGGRAADHDRRFNNRAAEEVWSAMGGGLNGQITREWQGELKVKESGYFTTWLLMFS